MQTATAVRAVPANDDFGGTPCPNCGAPVSDPVSSDYRGLGRIEHRWRCPSCGETFRTAARMAGTLDLDAEAGSTAAA